MGYLKTFQDSWKRLGTWVAGNVTTPDKDNRTPALMAAVSKVQFYELPPTWNNIKIRCQQDTDGEVTVFDLFKQDNPLDDWTRICTLTFTTGQQPGATGYLYADTVAVSNEYWPTSVVLVSPAGDYIAEVLMDSWGMSKIAVVGVTVPGPVLLDITGR